MDNKLHSQQRVYQLLDKAERMALDEIAQELNDLSKKLDVYNKQVDEKQKQITALELSIKSGLGRDATLDMAAIDAKKSYLSVLQEELLGERLRAKAVKSKVDLKSQKLKDKFGKIKAIEILNEQVYREIASESLKKEEKIADELAVQTRDLK